MKVITIEDEEGNALVEFDENVWRVFDRFENREPVTLFHNTVEDSPFYLFRELEQFDDADEILRKLSRKSERLESIFDLFFVERSRLERRVVCLERSGFGVLDEFIDLISLSGNQEEGFIVEATTQDDKTLNVKRNALGEVVHVIAENVFTGDDFIAAFDEITSDERWDSIGWDWKEIISNLGKSLPTLAKEVSELIGEERRENPRRIKNEFFYFKRIESYFNGNRLNLALETANKGIEIFPFCEILYASRGEVYFSKGLIDEAITDYETAIHLGMDAPSLFVNAGICYGVKHDYVQAIESYTKAIEIDQKAVNAYLARASAYRALGKIELAQKDKESAEELSAQETANQKPRCELHNLELEEIEVSKPRAFLSYERGVLLFRQRLRDVSSELFPNCEVPIPGDTGKTSKEALLIIFRRLACPKCVMLRDAWVAENSERYYEELELERLLRTSRMSLEPTGTADNEKDAIGSKDDVEQDFVKKESSTSRRMLITLILFRLGYLSWTGAYILSVYESYFANGFWKTLLIAIPILGQILWAGVKFASVGVFNAYCYLLFIGLILVSLAYFTDDKK